MLYQLSYTRPKSMPIVNFQLPIETNWQSAFGNWQFLDGAGGRIRTYVGREPAGFTARCH
jgi:hypothetical protein